ncbi:DEAD/DEAH box helicase [uncultured Methanobrevibacter sp.]|uniref:DEAD/DEAH box helicase n=1 Tax=uncultured Methanobrevibacter sp. TaxID=253161 RepID=UPI0025D59CF2|nr:DEAD/DEAH box helicase [uncultured Methanobrevibacter sp.]
MSRNTEKLAKKQLKNPADYNRFKKLIKETKIYDAPKTLTGELRPYQKIGYSWLIQNIRYKFGSILADDMGLGKTMQVLSAILYYKEHGILEDKSCLIIVPPTLIPNWENEIKKFTPDLTYFIYHGSNRTFPLEDYDIILTSYGVIRQDLDMFLDRIWFLCVIDEAQNIKNPNTQQTKAIKEVQARTKIAITGTPIENKLTDYWSIFDFVNKGYLSSLDSFKANYVMRIERLEETETLEKFKTITKPFVMRRLKTDDNIKDELPDKIVNDIYCSLTNKQIKLYNAIMDGIFEDLEGKTGIERRGIILNIITGLKQTCNHPAQFLRSDNPKISESGKMELLITILENILDMNEKVIIFTQYAQMGEIIRKLVSKKLKTDVLFLHGSLSQQKRTEVIDKFQENKDYKILVATLKTGGVGLNLTAAQNVIHYDLWWNPAIENQATDRVHRIGQKSDVMVYRFITKGTLEEVIDEMSKNKLNLAEKAISSDETFITEMTDEELKEKLSLRL